MSPQAAESLYTSQPVIAVSNEKVGGRTGVTDVGRRRPNISPSVKECWPRCIGILSEKYWPKLKVSNAGIHGEHNLSLSQGKFKYCHYSHSSQTNVMLCPMVIKAL